MVVSGQNSIRGIDIQKAAVGFADVEFIFKQFLNQTTTSAREMRWYSKTAGVLDSTDTTGITASNIYNSAPLAQPSVVEQSWTRNTSYIKKYFVESPWISEEDIQDSDPDIWATNIRDLVRAVAAQEDIRIYNILTENTGGGTTQTIPLNTNYSVAAGAAGWSGASANPIVDLLSGSKAIMTNNYDTKGLVTMMHPNEYQDLLNYLIVTKGSSVPEFASGLVENGVLLSLLGQKIVVSNNVNTGYIVQFVPQRSATLKTFTPLTTATKIEEGIGRKIRVWLESEAILTDPKAVHLLSGA